MGISSEKRTTRLCVSDVSFAENTRCIRFWFCRRGGQPVIIGLVGHINGGKEEVVELLVKRGFIFVSIANVKPKPLYDAVVDVEKRSDANVVLEGGGHLWWIDKQRTKPSGSLEIGPMECHTSLFNEERDDLEEQVGIRLLPETWLLYGEL